ncbi:hypothetical protein DF281_14100, partial [Kurthia zopfii]
MSIKEVLSKGLLFWFYYICWGLKTIHVITFRNSVALFRFYYICWGIKTIHVVTFRKNECFPPTSAALFLSTLGGKKGLL